MSSILSRAGIFAIVSAFFSLPTAAANPWIYGKLPMVATPLDSSLARTWSGLKKRNIQPWSDGLLHRPKSETPGDAVSEGQAYAMTIALYQNDQAAFNSVWDATESKLWNESNKAYDWRIQDGKITGPGMAPDADEDIALMLIFADALQTKGVWNAHTSPKGVSYKSRAQTLVASIWDNAVNHDNGALRPAPGWGGGGTCTNGKDNWDCGDHVNPSYFSPASYRIFKNFDPGHDWSKVIDKSYQVLSANPGYSKGLLPDWTLLNGQSVQAAALGYNPFYGGQAFYKDAIRILWRLSWDWLWFREPRAKTFLDNAYAFMGGNPAKANFYRMDGSLVPVESTFTLSGTQGPTRSRREHSHLTVGMWACAAMASAGADSADTWARELLRFRDTTSDFWGKPQDPTGGKEDTAHNEMYFDQFMAWFGASVLAGRFTNVLADLSDPEAGTALTWKQRPLPVMPLSVGSVCTIQASWSRSAAWAVRVLQPATGAEWTTTGVGTSMNFNCSPSSAFKSGKVDMNVRVRGLADTTLTMTVGVGVQERRRLAGFRAEAVAGGLRLSGPEAFQVVVRDLSGGVVRATADLGAGTHLLTLAGSGLRVVETFSRSGTGTNLVLLRP